MIRSHEILKNEANPHERAMAQGLLRLPYYIWMETSGI